MGTVIIYAACICQVWVFLRFSPRFTTKSQYWKVNGSIIAGFALLLVAWLATPLSDLTDRRHSDPRFFWFNVPALSFFVFAFPYFFIMAAIERLVLARKLEQFASPNGGPAQRFGKSEADGGP